MTHRAPGAGASGPRGLLVLGDRRQADGVNPMRRIINTARSACTRTIFRGPAASQGAELETALGAMTGLGYVTGDEVAQIPVMETNHSNVTYGPLNEAQTQPTLILVVADAAQGLTLTEAVARVDGQAPPAMGRPAWHSCPKS